ncbi:MAG: hypothetical protein ABI895_26175 [Deltaproteobacteria bacterium]
MALAAEAFWALVSTLDSLVVSGANLRATATATETARPVDLESGRPQRMQASVARPPPIAQRLDVVPRSTTDPPRHALEEHAERPTPLALPPTPEFHGASCAGVFVYIVTVAENAPSRSAASFATSETARTNFAHPGEVVGGWELLAITDDWTGANPVVWLLREDEVCRTGLTGNPARLQAILQQEEQERQAQRARWRRRRRRRR